MKGTPSCTNAIHNEVHSNTIVTIGQQNVLTSGRAETCHKRVKVSESSREQMHLVLLYSSVAKNRSTFFSTSHIGTAGSLF